jgi:hypothetical protein
MIASSLNELSHGGTKIRTPKACRERWVNRVNPNLSNIEWTQEEDIALLTHVSQLGKKWSAISKYLPHKTETMVKMRYYFLSQQVSEFL